MPGLAEADGQAVPGIEPARIQWLVCQAKLQFRSVSQEIPAYHIHEREPDSQKGLAALPEASIHDVFFDIEGFSLEGDGLEYLWGSPSWMNKERALSVTGEATMSVPNALRLRDSSTGFMHAGVPIPPCTYITMRPMRSRPAKG